MIRWRLMVGVLAGCLGGVLAAAIGAHPALRELVGWNVGVLVYLALLWSLFLTASEADVRARAGRRDEARWVILAIVVSGVVASLGAIVWAMLSVKQMPPGYKALILGLAIFTLIGAWILLQSVFALHYAHEHFRAVERNGDKSGIVFPGEPARTYMDFIYLAVCVGATGQVSDPNVTTSSLRNLVTVHGATAFFFNTAVLALGINILASLLSG